MLTSFNPLSLHRWEQCVLFETELHRESFHREIHVIERDRLVLGDITLQTTLLGDAHGEQLVASDDIMVFAKSVSHEPAEPVNRLA